MRIWDKEFEQFDGTHTFRVLLKGFKGVYRVPLCIYFPHNCIFVEYEEKPASTAVAQ